MDTVAQMKAGISSHLSLGHLSDSEQEKVIAELVALVIDRVQLEIWKRLDIEDRKVFAALSEEEEITNFMKAKVPDMASVIELSTLLTVQQFNTSLSG